MRRELIVRYIIFFLILSLAAATYITAHGAKVNTREVRLFFVDAEMLRLMPVTTVIPEMNTQKTAQRALDELIKGRDDNPKIRRLIPNIRRCMTVKVKDGIAYVDLRRDLVENHPDGRDLEILTVYSIVNTLTELDGIKTVRFTVCGKTRKEFMGYLDMRETFVPDYFV